MAKYVYGPVKSRRLGSSLGVDIVPMKTCSFDCVYCQLGGSYRSVIERDVYAPADKVVREVLSELQKQDALDHITLGGCGEPTLNNAFGEIAEKLRKVCDIPIALLTNGSLMWMEEVRGSCRHFDLVIPSLDACNESIYQKVNRPHPSLQFEKIVNGLIKLRNEYGGKIWLEIFLIAGMNCSDQNCSDFKALIDRIRPDRVHLNTAVRPPAEPGVYPPNDSRMQNICRKLGQKAELITPPAENAYLQGNNVEENIMCLVWRRPCTAEEIAAACQSELDAISDKLTHMVANGKIKEVRRGDKKFFKTQIPAETN